MKFKPKIGVAFTSVEGYDLDQDKLEIFEKKAKTVLDKMELEKVYLDFKVKNEKDSKKANALFLKENVDLLLIIVGVWTPDSTVVSLVNNLKMPIIVFTTSLSIHTVSVNGAQVIVASLKELGYDFKFIFGDIGSAEVHKKIKDYSTAAAIVKKLKNTRIGLVGHIPDIMLSLEVDSFSVKNIFGPIVVPIDFYKIDYYLGKIKNTQVQKRAEEIRNTVGAVRVDDAVLEDSVKYYFAFRQMIKDLGLDALTVNCFPIPYIKGKTCLATSNLNDDGIVTACEGDVNSTIVMLAFQYINGTASLNSDIIIENQEENAMMFSHCGAGPFSCASDCKDIVLEEQYEVKSGMAVYYPVKTGGKEATIVNLVGRESTYRMCILNGISIPTTKLSYHGNPIQIKFNTNVVDLINQIGNEGFGHHWMVAYGDHKEIFIEIAKLVRLKHVTHID
jgi:L-fucose isomerase-like protein